MERELQIIQDIAEIRQLLHKETVLQNLLGTTPILENRILEEVIYEKPRKIGKAESFIGRHATSRLLERADVLRDWLEIHGKVVEESGRTKVIEFDANNNCIHADFGDITPRKKREFDRLVFIVDEDKTKDISELIFCLDYSSRYTLEMSFIGAPRPYVDVPLEEFDIDEVLYLPSPNEFRYFSGRLNLSRMDVREHRIVSYFLDEFCNRQQVLL